MLDNNKENKLTFNNGLSRSSNTISNSGVRSIATGTSNGTISVNTNGTTSNVSVKGLGSNAYTSTKYLPLSGGTITGNLDIHLSSNSGLEIYSGSGGTYIDLHRKGSTSDDYSTRIIEPAFAGTAGGYLDFQCLPLRSGVTGDAAKFAILRAADYMKISSKHVKENIKDISNEEALKLLQLRPVSFDYKNWGEKDQRGLIAEEVLEVLPNMVKVPDNYTGFDPEHSELVPSIDYTNFVPYLIKMIQIQQKEIEELKK